MHLSGSTSLEHEYDSSAQGKGMISWHQYTIVTKEWQYYGGLRLAYIKIMTVTVLNSTVGSNTVYFFFSVSGCPVYSWCQIFSLIWLKGKSWKEAVLRFPEYHRSPKYNYSKI